MRRLIALAFVLVCASTATARAGSIAVGAFGGMSYPIVQNDVGNGTLYGLRAPVSLVPFLTVEPYWATSSLGDKVLSTPLGDVTSKGPDQSAFGANVLLATGGPVSFFPFGGVGQATFKSGGVSKSFTTYDAGFGIAFSAVTKLKFNVRGEFQAVMDGSTVRKFGNATAGVSYALFGMP